MGSSIDLHLSLRRVAAREGIRPGMTLIELLVVVSIIALLGALSCPLSRLRVRQQTDRDVPTT